MPLVENVPAGRDGWIKTVCPRCGAECWESPQARSVKKMGAKGMCTYCVLKTTLNTTKKEDSI